MATKVKTKAKDPTHVILGMSTSNEVIHSPISKFPHALIAGTTLKIIEVTLYASIYLKDITIYK